MRIQYDKTASKPSGYTMWLSARDTYDWAHRIGATWCCSTCSNHRIVLVVDDNGLLDIAIDGKKDSSKFDIDSVELNAIVSDYLPKQLRHLWPTWE